MLRKAPWPDFEGNDLHQRDWITHPDGETGKIVYDETGETLADKWLVDYYYPGQPYSRLCLQVGAKGQARKLNLHRLIANPGGLEIIKAH